MLVDNGLDENDGDNDVAVGLRHLWGGSPDNDDGDDDDGEN